VKPLTTLIVLLLSVTTSCQKPEQMCPPVECFNVSNSKINCGYKFEGATPLIEIFPDIPEAQGRYILVTHDTTFLSFIKNECDEHYYKAQYRDSNNRSYIDKLNQQGKLAAEIFRKWEPYIFCIPIHN